MDARLLTDAERRERIGLAKGLRFQGVSCRDIATQLGHSEATIRGWLDPDYAERQRELAKQRAAKRRTAAETVAAETRRNRRNQRQRRERLRQADRKKLTEREERTAVRALRGDRADAYRHVRLALQRLDVAVGNERNDLVRMQLRKAQASLHDAEDAVVAAGHLAA